jgi:hypothetical protein
MEGQLIVYRPKQAIVGRKRTASSARIGAATFYLSCLLHLCCFGTAQLVARPAMAQVAQPNLSPITIAQTVTPLPSLYPTDTTPVNIGREQEMFRPGPTFYLLQKLPARSWFNLSAEASQRYESNVFLQRKDGRSDYVFRILPNISVGYNLEKNTSIYVNYFVIKDVFAGRPQLTFPTNQSLALGVRREVPLGTKATLQFDFQARELWQVPHVRQADLLPGVTYTRVISPRTIAFGNMILQLRGKNYFVAPTREIDPFYTVGFLRSYGNWVLTCACTLVTNFRHPPFNDAIPPVSNNAMIADFEISHPISKKLPNVVVFARAEPIWNWSSKGFPGISGYDFRFFTGIRYTLVKASYSSQIEKLRRQLKQVESLPPISQPQKQQDPKAAPSNLPPPEGAPAKKQPQTSEPKE